jgi:hypothetical protein
MNNSLACPERHRLLTGASPVVVTVRRPRRRYLSHGYILPSATQLRRVQAYHNHSAYVDTRSFCRVVKSEVIALVGRYDSVRE